MLLSASMACAEPEAITDLNNEDALKELQEALDLEITDLDALDTATAAGPSGNAGRGSASLFIAPIQSSGAILYLFSRNPAIDAQVNPESKKKLTILLDTVKYELLSEHKQNTIDLVESADQLHSLIKMRAEAGIGPTTDLTLIEAWRLNAKIIHLDTSNILREFGTENIKLKGVIRKLGKSLENDTNNSRIQAYRESMTLSLDLIAKLKHLNKEQHKKFSIGNAELSDLIALSQSIYHANVRLVAQKWLYYKTGLKMLAARAELPNV